MLLGGDLRRIIALLTVAAIVAPALAQSPLAGNGQVVTPWPPLGSTEHSWAQYRQSLKDEEAGLSARIAAHNAQCNAVANDNVALVAQCQQSRVALQAASAAYQANLAAYQRDLAQSTHPATPPVIIGSAATVLGEVMLEDVNGETQRMVVGGSLSHDSRITTGSTGQLRIRLKDNSEFTIGPGAEVILDDFVYDPNTSIATSTAQVVKGFFRLVTGKIHRLQPDRFKVRVNLGTIGIRGTDLAVNVAADGSAVIKLYSGAAVYTPDSGGGVVTLTAGQMFTLSNTGIAGLSHPID